MYGEISFPELGLFMNPSRIAFSIGPKPIYWYGIIIAFGFLLAVGYALKRSKVFGLTQDNVIDMLIYAVPMAIVGARLYYCIFTWEVYRSNPISILYIWEGGLAIYGGVIGAVIGLVISTRVHKIPAGPLLDIGGLGLLIGQCIGRWGNFINREAFGAATDSFLRMGLTDSNGVTNYYHPTFLYESMWNALGFILLHFLSRKRKYDGQIFTAYIGWYGLGRLFIEGLRTDSLYLAGTNLRVSQLMAGLCLLTSIILLFYNWIFCQHDSDELFVAKNTNGASEEHSSVKHDSGAEESTDCLGDEAAIDDGAEDSKNDEEFLSVSIDNPKE